MTQPIYDYAIYKQRARRPKERARRMIEAAQQRYRKRGKYPVSLTREWLVTKLEAGVCEVSGLPFDYDRPGWAPSLDRTDNSLGYTEENTQVVCWMYNAAKGVMTHDDVLRFAEALCTIRKR